MSRHKMSRSLVATLSGALALWALLSLNTSAALLAEPMSGSGRISLERYQAARLNDARRSYEAGRAQQARLRAQARSLPSQKSSEEDNGDYNVKRITANFLVSDFELPRRGRFSITIESNIDGLEQVQLLRYGGAPLRVWLVRDDGSQLDLRSSWDELNILLEVTIPPLNAGEELTIWMRGPVDYLPESPFGHREEEGLCHYVGVELLPANYQYLYSDSFELITEFEVERQGLFPNAQGRQTVSGDPNSGLGTWRYESEAQTDNLAFTLTDRPFYRYSEQIDMSSPQFAGGIAESFFGFLASEIISSYARLVAPFPFERFTISTLSEEVGVAIGPLGMILMPDDYWRIDAQQDDLIQWYLESLMAHEIGHQYFPHLVQLQADAPNWLSEGFAEYLSAVHLRELYGHDYLIRENHWQYMYFELPFGQEEPSIVSPEIYELELEAYFVILYKRGASVLHQLSRRYENFSEILASYVQAHSGRFVHTQDFIDALNTWGVLRAERPLFDLNAYLDATLFGNERLSLSVEARWIDDEQSRLNIVGAGPLSDSLELELRAVEGGAHTTQSVYASLAQGISFSGLYQAVTIDPNLEHFLIQERAVPEDIDLNGVVDGLDALELLAHEGLTVDGAPSDVRRRPKRFSRVYDLDRDGDISQQDLIRLLERFGEVTLD